MFLIPYRARHVGDAWGRHSVTWFPYSFPFICRSMEHSPDSFGTLTWKPVAKFWLTGTWVVFLLLPSKPWKRQCTCSPMSLFLCQNVLAKPVMRGNHEIVEPYILGSLGGGEPWPIYIRVFECLFHCTNIWKLTCCGSKSYLAQLVNTVLKKYLWINEHSLVIPIITID